MELASESKILINLTIICIVVLIGSFLSKFNVIHKVVDLLLCILSFIILYLGSFLYSYEFKTFIYFSQIIWIFISIFLSFKYGAFGKVMFGKIYKEQ